MATRGFVGFGTPERWIGAYNHNASEPSLLGRTLWPVLVDAAQAGGLPALRDALLAGGRVEALLGERHDGTPLVAEAADPIAIEWLYLVDDAARLHVLANLPLRIPETGAGDWTHAPFGTFALAGPEPDWRAIERARKQAAAPVLLQSIRERFGDEAYESARLELLGDDA
jgi:hypothetical protein